MRRSLVLLATLLIAGSFLPLHAQSALATTTTLAVGPSSSVPLEQTVTLTATIVDSNNNPVLHGTVAFYDGTLALGTSYIISNASGGFTPGTAILRTRSLAQTTHSLTATFNGTVADQKSTSTAQTVTITAAAGPYPSATTLTATPASAGVWNLTADVAGLGPAGPTGNVTFNDTTAGTGLGTTALGTSALNFGVVGSTALTADASGLYCEFPVASGDFNNDGYLDLVVVDAGMSSGECTANPIDLAVEPGNGTGTFTAGVVDSNLTGTGTPSSCGVPLQALVADFNGDGNADLLFLCPTDPGSPGVALEVFLGNGDGTFQSPTILPVGSDSPQLYSLAIADFNNDGIPDLVVVYDDQASSQSIVTVYLGNGAGGFSATGNPITFPIDASEEAVYAPQPVATGDLNNDGNADVVVGIGTQVAVLLGEGNGSFQTPALYGDGDTSQYPTDCGENCSRIASQSASSIALADLRNDGNVDIIVGSSLYSVGGIAGSLTIPQQISVLPGNGSGTYSTYTAVTSCGTPVQIFVGDFSFTGVPGVLEAGPVVNDCLLAGNGDATLQAPVDVSLPPMNSVSLSVPGNTFPFSYGNIAGDFTNSGGLEFASLSSGDNSEVASFSASVYEPGMLASATLSNASPSGSGTQMADAVYAGDSNFSGSTSAAIPLIGGALAEIHLFVASPDGSSSDNLLPGYGATLTALVQPPSLEGTPTGTIQFIIDGVDSGGPMTLSGGSAGIPVEWSTPGTHSVEAIYSGDSTFAPTTQSVTLTVAAQAPTSVNFTSGYEATYVSGNPFNFTVEVLRETTGPTPTGTVTITGTGLTLQGTLAGTPATASFTINTAAEPLPVGPYDNFAVTYSGDAVWQSSKAAGNFAVTGTTALSISYSGPSTVNAGSPITIAWQLGTNQPAGSGSEPTGTVTLLDNGKAIATSSSPDDVSFTINTLAQSLPAGSNQLSLSYSGDSNWAGSTSSTISVTVDLTDAIVLTSNLPPDLLALPGATVQFTTTVSPEGSSTLATGTVQYYDGTTAIGAPVPLSGGTASYTSTGFAAGNHSISAKYSGDSNYPAATSNAIAFTVTTPPLATSVGFYGPTLGYTLLAGSPVQANVLVGEGQAVAGPPPTGAVTVTSGGTTIATGTLTAGCPIENYAYCSTATLTLNPGGPGLPLGVDPMTVSYGGDSNWKASTSSNAGYQVEQVQPTMQNFGCRPAAANPNVGTTLTCDGIFSWIWGLYPVPSPAGAIELFDNGNLIASETIPNLGTLEWNSVNGQFGYSFTVNTVSQPLTAGTHVFSATFPGDASWLSVTTPTSSVTLTANLPGFMLTTNLGSYSSAVQGTPVTFTATATAVNGLPTPTGTVQFYIDGAAAGGPVTMTNGVATYTTLSLSSGSHTITASYSGNSLYSSTTTNGSVVVVPQGPDTLAITVSGAATVAAGTPVTVNGTLTVGALGPAPTGAVTLMDGTTSIATATLSGSSPFALSFNVNTASSPLAVGSHSFRLKYAGTTQWAASVSSTAAVTVSQAATSTAVTSSAATANGGASVTFTATVTSTVTSPAPTGTVQFYDGTTALGSAATLANNTATYTTSTLTGGTHSITAVYSGDANFATSTSPAFTENIQGIMLTSTAITGTVSPGGSASYTLTVTSEGGLNESTSFACSGLPQGAACNFSPATVTGSGSTTLTITTSGSSAATAPNPLKLWTARGAPVLACVVLLLAPVRRRKQLLFLVLLAVVPALTVGCGGGGGCGGNCVTYKGTPAGTYTITVTSTTGSGTSAITATTTVTLTVQ